MSEEITQDRARLKALASKYARTPLEKALAAAVLRLLDAELARMEPTQTEEVA